MILKKIKAFLKKGSNRSSLIKKNILATFLIKGISIIISLLYVPLTLNYLNPTRYGIWITLTSIVAWMGIFDIGLGNGLRNKLAESLAVGNHEKSRKYVSTAYAMLTIIVICVLSLFFIANNWINWSSILNTSENYGQELKSLSIIVVTLFGLKFVLNIISTIFISDQLPAIGSIFEVIGNAIGLFIIWILTITNKSSLITFGFAAMLTPVIVYLAASIYFYNKKYLFLKPSWSYVDMSYAKDLTGLGIKFFVIQIAVLIIFQTSNILISQFFTPAEVTPYNITFKYFGILTMFCGIIMNPLWSAFTQAKTINDVEWMKKTIKLLNKAIIAIILILIIMAFIANYIITIWTNNQIVVHISMVWIFAFYTLISIWNNIYAFFLNGIGETRVQIITSIFAASLHIPLAFVFVKFLGLGSEGIVLSMALSLSLFAIAGPIQTYKILKSWNRI